jgi:hypothetical protein
MLIRWIGGAHLPFVLATAGMPVDAVRALNRHTPEV